MVGSGLKTGLRGSPTEAMGSLICGTGEFPIGIIG